MDTRFQQANREAIWSVLLTLFYLVAWTVTAYGFGDAPGLTGLPVWFELSCLLVPAVFVVLCWLMVRYLFVDMPLSASEDGKE